MASVDNSLKSLDTSTEEILSTSLAALRETQTTPNNLRCQQVEEVSEQALKSPRILLSHNLVLSLAQQDCC